MAAAVRTRGGAVEKTLRLVLGQRPLNANGFTKQRGKGVQVSSPAQAAF